MIGLAWNFQGLGSPRAENALKGIIKVEHPHFFFLSETKLKGKEWENLKRKLNFENSIFVDCIGDGRQRRGGLALFWDESLDLKLQSFSVNHMDFMVTLEMGSQ
ncbi:hypothetical protein POM88_052648 [Heracleum sosnowskyi]|uniref:Endonuclease/exonuclease/phosphatase n=1 Tax=Heracleum sosnowskyi TaxID=360622 RepID=A0AAD8GRF2_9APIA|nr:hypothetical protein POM88_052648 [Heracleum sosnowskyi]